jgi:hypothetical protein
MVGRDISSDLTTAAFTFDRVQEGVRVDEESMDGRDV